METSAPMEITIQTLTNGDNIHDQTDIIPELAVVSSPAPAAADDKFFVSVEACLKPSSTAEMDDVKLAVERMMVKRNLSYVYGPVDVPSDETFLVDNVQRICICDTEEWVANHDIMLFWQVKPLVHVYQLSEEGPCEDLDGDNQIFSFSKWILPAKKFDGMWESLIYESDLKQRLLKYAASALLFTEKGVDPLLVAWNRIILLHGPPGTGKTCLSKALAQKLSIRFSSRYPHSQLVQVNARLLFSKWLSESGKLVGKIFQKIQEMVEENNLVFVLIDEVESLAVLSGSEHSDSIQVINALLTQMDKLRSSPNVIILLTTSNITAAIDIEFVDGADIKEYVGHPSEQARYEILRSSLQELLRTGLLSTSQKNDGGHLILPNYASCKSSLASPNSKFVFHIYNHLLEAAEASKGLSGRTLRKLPFLAHAALAHDQCPDPTKLLLKMINIINRDLSPQIHLPPDLIESIIHFLPPKFLARFKLVSKRWYSLISSPDFIKTHIQSLNKNNPNPDPTHLILRSYVDDDDSLYSLDIKQLNTQTTPTTVTAKPFYLHSPKPRFRLLGSCNGLVLACDRSYNLYLVNPTTKKILKVLVEKQRATYGFGYDSSKDDYKIVLIPEFRVTPNSDFSPDNKFVGVYSLRNKSWKNIYNPPNQVHDYCSSCGVLLNNNLHFIVGDDLEISIAVFCLANEEFHVIEFPKSVKHDDKTCTELFTLGEKLAAVICVRCHDRVVDYELWVMEEYGVLNSWKKLCDIENGIGIDDEFFVSVSNRDILVGNSDLDEICIYNLDESRYTSVKVKGCSQDFLVYGSYVESLESLDRFC